MSEVEFKFEALKNPYRADTQYETEGENWKQGVTGMNKGDRKC